MERFLTRHGDRIDGIVAGFDRLLFRGTRRSISYRDGMDKFVSRQRVLYQDFAAFAAGITARVRAHAEALQTATGRPLEYVASSKISQDARAREILARDGVTDGLVCIFSCVESCRSFTVAGNRATKQLHLKADERKCLHFYFYFLDRDFGLMHVRVQTWLPLTLQICVNGRAWVARQLTRARQPYAQEGNSVIPKNCAATQHVADQLGAFAWEPWLTRYATLVNPWLDRTGHALFRAYYWSVRESEYATDVIFRDSAALQAVYPRLLHHAIEHFQTGDVLRFLGWVQPGRFKGEAHSTLVHRPEGGRIRHWLDENSIKMYDKAGRVLRVELTLNNPDRFRVRRRNTAGPYTWLPLRRGIADMRRRADLGRAATQRYLEALSVVGEPTPSHHRLDPVSHRVIRHGRPYRPLRPISPEEAPLFRTVLRGEFALQGFRSRDLQRALCPATDDLGERRRQGSRMTRLLRLRRAHRLIHKVGTTRYYRVSAKGHQIMTTALAFRETDIALLAA